MLFERRKSTCQKVNAVIWMYMIVFVSVWHEIHGKKTLLEYRITYHLQRLYPLLAVECALCCWFDNHYHRYISICYNETSAQSSTRSTKMMAKGEANSDVCVCFRSAAIPFTASESIGIYLCWERLHSPHYSLLLIRIEMCVSLMKNAISVSR